MDGVAQAVTPRDVSRGRGAGAHLHDETVRHQLVHWARDRARRRPQELGGLGPALVEPRGAVPAEAVDARKDAERHTGEPE